MLNGDKMLLTYHVANALIKTLKKCDILTQEF